MKIILSGHPQQSSDFVASALALANHVVDRVDDASEALELARTSACDAVILCPASIEVALCRVVATARAAMSQSAIIIMSATIDNGIDALLGAGANDVVTARIGKHLLLARLTAVIRRAFGHGSAELTVGALKIGLTSRVCTVAGQMVSLTPMEFRLAEALALRRGQVVSRQTLLELLYLDGSEPLPKSIDLFAHNIRRKLASADGAACLATWGRGLILQGQASASQPAQLSASAA